MLVFAIALSTKILGRFALLDEDCGVLLNQMQHLLGTSRILHVTGIPTMVIKRNFRDLQRHACKLLVVRALHHNIMIQTHLKLQTKH